MRVDDERVGQLDAVLRPALLVEDPCRARVRRVHVHPRARRVRTLGELAHRVDGGERRRADRGNDHGDVGEIQPVRAHAQLVVGRRLAQLHAEHARGLLDGRVRMLGAHDDVPPGDVARCDERGERPRRSGVLDVPVPPFGQAEQLSHPVDRPELELGGRRRRAPRDRHLLHGRGEELGEDPRLRCRDREVREEARVLPVGERGNDELVEVTQDVRERLRLLRRRCRELCRQLARCGAAENRQLADAVEVVRGPVDGGVAVLAERHGRFRCSLRNCAQVRVLTRSSFVSQPRRA